MLLPIEAFTYFRYLIIFKLILVSKVCHITLHMVVFVFVVYAQGPLDYCIEINFILSYLILACHKYLAQVAWDSTIFLFNMFTAYIYGKTEIVILPQYQDA